MLMMVLKVFRRNALCLEIFHFFTVRFHHFPPKTQNMTISPLFAPQKWSISPYPCGIYVGEKLQFLKGFQFFNLLIINKLKNLTKNISLFYPKKW